MAQFTKRAALKALITAKKWQQLTPSSLDSGYALLTQQQKQDIINSIVNGDNIVKDIIKDVLSKQISAAIDATIESIETAGTVSVDMLDQIL